jgi:molybdenum cofactor synthesis domain-containing protein
LPDTAGPAVRAIIAEKGLGEVVAAACVADDRDAIVAQLTAWCADGLDLVLSTGGTGLAPRDLTPEATLAVIERRHEGLVELMRLRAYPRNPRAFLSRGVAGIARRTLIVNLPGSPRGATECVAALADVLPHALATLRGRDEHVDERRGSR